VKKLVLAAAFAIFLILAGRSLHVASFDARNLLSRSDPTRQELERHLERFDDARFGYVLVHSEKAAWKGSEIQSISREVSEFLEHDPSVTEVISPQNAHYFVGSEYFNLARLLPKPEFSDAARSRLRSEVWKRTLFPDDPQSLLIQFEFAPGASPAGESELVANLGVFLRDLERRNEGIETRMSGARVARGRLFNETRSFLATGLSVLFLFLLLLLALVFQDRVVLAWSAAVVAGCTAAVSLLLLLLDGGVTPYGSLALLFAPILAAAGVTQFFCRFQRLDGGVAHRVAEAARLGGLPNLMTSLAIAAGFIALAASRLEPIRHFGLVCAFASLLQWAVVFHVLPRTVALFSFDAPVRRVALDRWLKFHVEFVRSRSTLLLGIFVAFFTLSVALMGLLRRGDSFPSILGASLGAADTIDVLLKPKYWDVLDPDNQATLGDFEKKIASIPGVERVASLTGLSDDLLADLAMRRPGRGERLRKELLAIFEEAGALKDFHTLASKEARSVVVLRAPDASGLARVLGELQSIESRAAGQVRLEVTGPAAMRRVLGFRAASDFARPVVLGSFLVFLCFCFVYRNVLWGLLGLVASSLPAAVSLALLGISRGSLDAWLAIPACAALGIGAGWAIHLPAAVRLNRGKAHTYPDLLLVTTRQIGLALGAGLAITVLPAVVFSLGAFGRAALAGLPVALAVGGFAAFLALPAAQALSKKKL
jgi:predicted RND superfamily exporter protein